MISVLLADSQFLIREGLKTIVAAQSDMEVVGESASPERLFEALQQHKPDLLIIDHDTMDFEQEDQWEQWLKLVSTQRVLIISQDQQRARITKLLEKGVNAFLTKCCDEEEIVSAIRAAVKGEKYFCNKVLDILIDSVREDSRDNCAPSSLTLREAEIVRLIASGTKTRDIAASLHLSPHTVNTHRKNIFKKLGIRSGQELVLYALNTGLLTAEPRA